MGNVYLSRQRGLVMSLLTRADLEIGKSRAPHMGVQSSLKLLQYLPWGGRERERERDSVRPFSQPGL